MLVLYLGAVAVGLPVELRVGQHVERHVADARCHVVLAQFQEDLHQLVQDEGIVGGKLDGLQRYETLSSSNRAILE